MEERTILETAVPPPTPGGATRLGGEPAPPGLTASGEATQQALVVTCQVCGTPNAPGERYCQDCGFMFGSAAPDDEPLPDPGTLPRLVLADGRELLLNPGANLVGRDGAGVLLADPTVSRRHAQLTLEGALLYVEDLGSTNGTSVAGRKLAAGERVPAHDGDSLKFGHVVTTLLLPGGEPRPAAVPEEAPATPARGEPVAFLVREDGSEVPLYPGANSIGRRSTNQIVLQDAFVSGLHAEIRAGADGALELQDLGSTNGTFVQGPAGEERLPPHMPCLLGDGESVRFGKTSLRVRLAAPACPPATEPPLWPPGEPAEHPAGHSLLAGEVHDAEPQA